MLKRRRGRTLRRGRTNRARPFVVRFNGNIGDAHTDRCSRCQAAEMLIRETMIRCNSVQCLMLHAATRARRLDRRRVARLNLLDVAKENMITT